MTIDRRTLLAGAGVAGVAFSPRGLVRAATPGRRFPEGFLWGAATAGHQVEGNNVASDLWLLEHVKPTIFAEPSGDAVNSFELWRTDLDLVKSLGLSSYRFSLEWARIEPEPGEFSVAMLDHYQAIIEGCRARGLTPVVTFNHFTAPRWFAAAAGWTNPKAPDLFARFCDRAARHLAADIGYAVTLNEPNLLRVLRSLGLPPAMLAAQRAMLEAAARASGTTKFNSANAANQDDLETMLPIMIAAHRQGRAAIKAVRPTSRSASAWR
jgi:beta-glucosidase